MLPFHGTRVIASSGRTTFRPPNIGLLAKTFDEKSPPRLGRDAAPADERRRETFTSEKQRNNQHEPASFSAGQSGADQGLPRDATADSESVEELLEEGNSFEAGIVFGVENSKDPNVSEVITHEVPEDDVPGEYLKQD